MLLTLFSKQERKSVVISRMEDTIPVFNELPTKQTDRKYILIIMMQDSMW